MAYWRSEWGQAEKEAYKAGIRKGRKLEAEENGENEEIPFMCDPNRKKTKIDLLLHTLGRINDQLSVVSTTLSRIEDRQVRAAMRNGSNAPDGGLKSNDNELVLMTKKQIAALKTLGVVK